MPSLTDNEISLLFFGIMLAILIVYGLIDLCYVQRRKATAKWKAAYRQHDLRRARMFPTINR